MQSELRQLDLEKEKVNADHELLKQTMEKFEKERRNCEADVANAIAEQDRVDQEYGDLIKRLNELTDIKTSLELK